MSSDYMKNLNFPKDDNNCSFSYSLFYRTISNGEKYFRKWLVYSRTVNATFCFCWKIFDPVSRSSFEIDGLKYIKKTGNIYTSTYLLKYTRKFA